MAHSRRSSPPGSSNRSSALAGAPAAVLTRPSPRRSTGFTRTSTSSARLRRGLSDAQVVAQQEIKSLKSAAPHTHAFSAIRPATLDGAPGALGRLSQRGGPAGDPPAPGVRRPQEPDLHRHLHRPERAGTRRRSPRCSRSSPGGAGNRRRRRRALPKQRGRELLGDPLLVAPEAPPATDDQQLVHLRGVERPQDVGGGSCADPVAERVGLGE